MRQGHGWNQDLEGFFWFLLGWRQGEGSKTYCYLFQTSNSSKIRLWGVEFHLFPGKQPNLPCFFLRFSHCLAGFGIQTAGAGLKIGIQSCPHTELFLTHGHTWWRFWKLGSIRRIHPWTLFKNQGWDGSRCRWGAKPYKSCEVVLVQTMVFVMKEFLHFGYP